MIKWWFNRVEEDVSGLTPSFKTGHRMLLDGRRSRQCTPTLSCIRVGLFFILLMREEITGFSFQTYSSCRVIMPPAVKVIPRDFNLTTSPHMNQHFEQREYHGTKVKKTLKNPVITMKS
jgi:hypothetical protein